MLSCREVVPIMVAQGGGSIVNISSIGSLRYLNTPMAVYAAGKAALNGFTQNIALQYASKRVRANCVLPGYIDTPWFSKGRGEAGAKAVRDSVIARVPLKVASSADDIATLVCFLATPASSSMTGEIVRMDAGLHLIT